MRCLPIFELWVQFEFEIVLVMYAQAEIDAVTDEKAKTAAALLPEDMEPDV